MDKDIAAQGAAGCNEAADMPSNVDRRQNDRHLTLFRVGSIQIDGRRELCLIKNISNGGMMIRPYFSMSVGSTVAVELKSGEPIEGKISWARGDNAGIAFNREIKVTDVLASAAAGPKPRLPRVETSKQGTIREGAMVQPILIRDISQGGAKVEFDKPLTLDSDVVVSLPGLGPQPAVVRWVSEGIAGIHFNRLLSLSELVEWIQAQRSDLKAAS